MSAPVLYQSSDASAPTLNGNAGSLATVLDACLVNGYGTQPAAGWTIAFTAANKRDYRQGGGNSFYLDVDDSAAQTALGREANLRGYEAMTALATGTNLFPTVAQIAAPSLNMRKSATADGTARAWAVIADDRTMHMFVFTADNSGLCISWSFGDFYSYVSADAGRTYLIARANANVAANTNLSEMQNQFGFTTVGGGAGMTGHYMARKVSGAAGSLQFGKSGFYNRGIDNTSGTVMGPHSPDPISGLIFVSRFMIGSANDSIVGIRGYLRGLYMVYSGSGVGPNNGDTFSGASGSGLSGRTFMVIGPEATNEGNSGNNSTGNWYFAVETSNTWDTSS